jgi:hypothetical protein
MKKALIPVFASMFLSAGAVTYAQEATPGQPPPAQQERQRTQEEDTPATLRGCLSKGTQAQEYVVADEKSGEKVSFGGPAKLDTYLDQTVEITGRIVDQGGAKAFQPQSIKSVSSSCKAAQQ